MKKWKRYLAVVLTLIMVACCLPTMGSNVKAEDTSTESVNTTGVYHAYTDFSTTNGNPNGAWKYEMRKLSNGEYQYTSMEVVNETQWGTANTVIASTQGGDGVKEAWTINSYQNIAMITHSQAEEAVLTFTAPQSGVIVIDMGNGYIGAATTETNSKAAHFAIEYNGATLTSADIDAGSACEIPSRRLSVSKGDTIRFVVGRNVAKGINVRINPTITYETVYEYNAYDDFSLVNGNPNGVWKYEYRKPSGTDWTYTDMETGISSTDRWYSEGWGSTHCQILTTQGGDGITTNWNGTTYKNIQMNFNDQTKQAVLTFIAPTSGTITVDIGNSGYLGSAVTTSGTQSAYFALEHNGNVLTSANVDASTGTTVKIEARTIEVEAGDVIRFVGGRTKATNTWLRINPTVTYTKVKSQELTVHNAYDDFSLVNGNPNGVWKYEYRKLSGTDYTYSDMHTESASTTTWYSEGYGSSHCSIGTTQGGDGIKTAWAGTTYKNIQMNFNDQTKQAVLTFVAPTSGTIVVDIGNQGYLGSATTTSGTLSAYFALEHNGNVLESANVDASTGTTVKIEAKTIEVEAGDVIRFVGGRTKATNTVLRINPTITYTKVDTGEKGITYYISNSGSDSNSGITEVGAWKSLSKLTDVALGENDKVLLKAGDTFTEQWVLNKVQGTEEYPVVIGTYGDVETGGKPCINPGIVDDSETTKLEIAAPCIQLNDAEGVKITGLKITGSGVGIHLNYDNSLNHEYVKIADCDFVDLTGFDIRDYRGDSDRSNDVNITGIYQMATAITTSVNNYNIGVDDPALIGLYIDKCTTTNCGTLYASSASIYATNEGGSDSVHGLYVTDCTMTNNDYYGIYIDGCVRGGYVSGCTIDTCGDATEFGPGTAGILLSTQDYAVINTEIKNQKRGGVEYDGVGIDFEHLCENVIVRNCYIHDNTGSGVLMYDSNSGSEHANVDCQIINNVFEENALEVKGNLYLHDDPFADIRMTSNTGYAATGCTIKGNSYYNSSETKEVTNGLVSATLTYTFVNDNQKVQPQEANTIENNTKLSERKNGFLEDAATVLAIYSSDYSESEESGFGNYNRSENKATIRTGATEPFATIIDEHKFQFASTFTTTLESVKSLWTPLWYGDNDFTKLTLNAEGTQWKDTTGAAIIHQTGMHPASKGQTVLQFTAPQTGRICINMTEALKLSSASSDGTYITVLDKELKTIAEPVWLKGGESKNFTSVYVTVQKGESIYICLSKCTGNANDSTTIKPEISYVYNDVNQDAEAKLNVCDIVRMKKMISEEEEVNTSMADYTGNGTVDNSDISVVRQYCINWWDTYSE